MYVGMYDQPYIYLYILYTYTFLQIYFIYYILHTYIIIHTIKYKCIYTGQTQKIYINK